MKLSNKNIIKLFESNIINLFPKKIIRLLIKKNKIFFIKTDLVKLPEKNYPFTISQEDLENKKKIFFENEFKVPTNQFTYLALITKLIFKKEIGFNFLDFGAQYIDNFFFLRKKNHNINYYYHDQVQNNIQVENFIKLHKLNNIKVLNNLDKLREGIFDFIYFGSVIQYINNFDNLLDKILHTKPKYLYFSGVNFFFNKNSEKFICKQFNVFPQVNYCFFFNFDYFKNLICSKNYELIYFSENQNSQINYSYINDSINDTCMYLDLFFKIKD